MNRDRKSSLHVAITSLSSELDSRSEEKINEVFEDLFSDSHKLASRSDESDIVELIYEVQIPIFNGKKEFYENLEILLEGLNEFNPHFTQLRRVDD